MILPKQLIELPKEERDKWLKKFGKLFRDKNQKKTITLDKSNEVDWTLNNYMKKKWNADDYLKDIKAFYLVGCPKCKSAFILTGNMIMDVKKGGVKFSCSKHPKDELECMCQRELFG